MIILLVFGLSILFARSTDATLAAYSSPNYVIVNQLISLNRLALINVAGNVYGIRFLDKDLLAYGHPDFSIRVNYWKTQTQTANISNAHTSNIRYLELLPGNYLASASDDMTIKVWNMNTTSFVRNMTGHTGAVYCLRLLTNTSLLASGSADKTIKIWMWTTGTLLFTLTGHTDTINSIETISSSLIASGSSDWTVRWWNLTTRTLWANSTGHGASVTAIRLLNSSILLSASLDAYIRMWNTGNASSRFVAGAYAAFSTIDVMSDGNITSGQTNSNFQYWYWTSSALTLVQNAGNGVAINQASITYSIDSVNLRLFIGSYQGQVRMWVAQNGVCQTILTSNSAGTHVKSMVLVNAFTLATGGEDAKVNVWNWKSQTQIWSFVGHSGNVRGLEFLADGQTIASGAEDYVVRLWSLANGTSIANLTGHTNAVYEIKQLLNGNIASASLDATVRIWNVYNRSTVFILSHSNAVYSLCVLPNGTLLTGSGDGIKSWNPNTGQLIVNLNQVTGVVICRIKYLYDGLIAAGFTTYIRIYNLNNNTLYSTWVSGGTQWGLDLVQRDYLATADDSGSYWRIWHIPTGMQVNYKYNNGGNWQYYLLTVDLDAPQLKGAFGTASGSVYVWDIINETMFMQIVPFTSPVLAIKFISYTRFVVAGGNGSIQVWSALNATQILSLSGHTGNVTSLQILPGGCLASGATDSTVRIWSYVNGSSLKALTGHSSSVNSVKLLSSGNLASASSDQTIKLWNWYTGSLINTLTGHTDQVLCLQIVQNGSLASGSADTTVLVWNTDTGILLMTLSGHTGSVNSLEYLSSYNYLASASSDTTIKLWDMTLGILVQTLTGHLSSITSLDVLNDGVSLVSGSLDSSVFVWNISLGGTIQQQFNHTTGVYSVEIFNFEPPLIQITGRQSNYSNPVFITRSSYTTFSGWMFFSASVYTNVVYTWQFYQFNATSQQHIGGAWNATTYNSTSSASQLIKMSSFNYTLYRVVLTVSLQTNDPPTSYKSQIDTFVFVSPTKIIVQGLANGSTNASVARYLSYSLNPVNYSYDFDNLLSMSQVSFLFYCRMVNKSQGFVYYLNQSTQITDLKTAQLNNSLDSNSCFNSTNGYYFDSTGNYLYINPSSLNYDPSFNNEFMIVTTNYGLFNYQMLFLNINPTILQIPSGSIACLNPADSTNDFGIVNISNNLVLYTNCSSGCQYVDSINYTYTIKKYSNSTWVEIISNMTEAAYITVSSNQINLNSQLFATGPLAWQVSVVIRTFSYGYQAVSNTTISQVIYLNQLPNYNSVCNHSSYNFSSLASNHSVSCQYVVNAEILTANFTVKKLDLLSFSPATFSPTLSYSSLAYSYQLYYLNASNWNAIGLNSSNRTYNLTNFGYGSYQMAVSVTVNISHSLGYIYPKVWSSVYFQIIPSGVVVRSLANGSTSASFARYQSFSISPVNYSSDIDGFLSMSAISFKFYCQRVDNSQGLVYYLNDSSIDLWTSKQTNSLPSGSDVCFASSDAYSFDSTDNFLIINPGYLKYNSSLQNVFIVTTLNNGVMSYQIITLGLNISDTQTPVVSISCQSSASCLLGARNDTFITTGENDVTLKPNCTFGCQYVDSVAYTYTVYVYNNSNWVAINSSSSDWAYLNQSINQLTLSNGLFKTGYLAWKFVLTTTTSSYSVQTSSSSTWYLAINQPYYNGSCNASSSQKGSFDIQCSYLTNYSPSSLKMITIRRTHALNFTGSIFLPALSYTWINYSYAIVSLNGSSTNTSWLTLNQNSLINFSALLLGQYRVYITTSVIVNTSISTFSATVTSFFDFDLIYSGVNVSALANFATQAWIGRYESFEVIPSNYSYDMDFVTASSELNFKFYCKVVPSSSGYFYYLNQSSVVDLRSAQQNSLDLSTTAGSCFDSTSSYSFDSTGNILYINADALKHYNDGSNNVFIVTTTNNDVLNYQIVYININISKTVQPEVNFNCSTPAFCKPVTSTVVKIADSNNLFFTSNCTMGCDYVDQVNYQFTVYKYNQSYWNLITSSDLESQYIYNSDTSNLVLLYSLFRSGLTQWKVDLQVTTVSYGFQTSSSTVTMIFALNLAPYNGTCSISPLTGYALQTDFTIICKYWADHDGNVAKYEYFATYTGNTNPYGLSYDEQGNVSLKLPAGPSNLNYQLTIFVCVFDDLDTPTEFVISTPVTVNINETLMSSIMTKIISGSSDSPVRATNSDPVSTANQVISISSTLDVLASSPSGNVNSIQQAKSSMMSAINEMTVNDLSTAKVIATSISTLTRGYTTIEKSAATSALDKSVELTTIMLDSISLFSFDFLMQAGNHLIFSMGNSLLALNNQMSSNPASSDTEALIYAYQQSETISSSIVKSVNSYLFNGQSSSITTSSINMTHTKSYGSEMSTSLSASGGGSFNVPSVCDLLSNSIDPSTCNTTFVVQQVSYMPTTVSGTNGNALNLSSSSTISLSYSSSTSEEYSVTDSLIDIWIPRSSWTTPSFDLFNSSANSFWYPNQLINFGFNVSTMSLAATLDIRPINSSLSYLVALKRNGYPSINESQQLMDSFEIFCPSDLHLEGSDRLYSYFIEFSSISFLGFGIRELTDTEESVYCQSSYSSSNSSLAPVLHNVTLNGSLSSDFYYRLYASSCVYFDKSTATWRTDGMSALSDSNSTHLHCSSTHLTDFSGGGMSSSPSSMGLPPSIDFGNAFANASFTQNLTIYLTIIITTCLYLLGLVWCIWMDKRDDYKRRIHLLEDNNSLDLYFYEIIVFTGNRLEAGTKSKVSFNLSGEKGDTVNRKLIPTRDKEKILERGSINTFVFSTPCSLGHLNYIRVWHDNSGKGRQASWFLKLIIVHDLQTREQFFFICENWLALNKGDGVIDRIIPTAGEKQLKDIKYLIERQTKEKLSDKHMWFSVVARPPLSSFSRADRLTCCLILMYISMLMNILYYGQSQSSSETYFLVLGPVKMSQTQIMTGVVTAIISTPPTLFLLFMFKLSRKRKTRSEILKDTMKKSNKAAHDDPKSKILIKKKKKFELPWWFKIIAYLLAVVYYIICAFFILIKAFTLGNDQTTLWLVSFLTSIFTDCFLSQPLQIAATSVILILLFRGNKKDQQDLEVDSLDQGRALNVFKNKNHELDDKQDQANYMLIRGAESSKLTELEVREYTLKKKQEKAHKESIRNIILYSLFIWTILLIAFTKVQSNAYSYKKALENLFRVNYDQSSTSFGQIKTIEDVWSWLKADDGFFASLLSNQSSYAINDSVSYTVGSVLLRQLRTKKVSCSSRKDLNIPNCYYGYSVLSEDSTNYGSAWSTYNSSQSSSTIDSAFQYKKGSELNTYPYVGEYASYGAGGYVYAIKGNSSLQSVLSDLNSLQRAQWLNQQSSTLFIQFSLFNANANLFAYCNILFEFLPTGNMIKYFQFIPFVLYLSPGFATLLAASEIVYMAIIVFFMIRLIRALVVRGWRVCFKQFWFWVDWVLIAFSWTAFSMFIYRIYAIDQFGKELNGLKPTSFVNMESLSYWDGLLVIFIAICAFISIIKTLQFLTFNSNLMLLIDTFKHIYMDFVQFAIVFIILWFSYVNLMYFYFSSYSSYFRSFLDSMLSTCIMLLGKFDISTFDNHQLVLGPVILISYSVAFLFVLLQLFVSIILNQYGSLRQTLIKDRDPSKVTMYDYLKQKAANLYGATIGQFRNKSINQSSNDLAYLDTTTVLERRSDQLARTIEKRYDESLSELNLKIDE